MSLKKGKIPKIKNKMKEEGWGMTLFSVGNVLDKGDYKPGDLCSSRAIRPILKWQRNALRKTCWR